MRDLTEIYQALVSTYEEQSGHSADGCDLSVRLYAAAAQIQALEQQADWVLDQSFPQTAQGIYLERHGVVRGIRRTEASYAEGVLRFSVRSASTVDLNIPVETVCMTSAGLRFQTTQAAVLSAGSLSVDVPAKAMEAGIAGNVATGTVSILAACPVGVTACTNPQAFNGGSDAEDDERLRERILESYQRLPNGANASYYRQIAMQHSGVVSATVIGRARGVGTVDVYIATEAGVPSQKLLEEVQADLQEKREIAVEVKTLAPVIQRVNVAIQLEVSKNPGFETVREEVEHAIAGYFNGRRLGKPVWLAELGQLIFAVSGVKNYHISAPASDQAADQTVLPLLGTLTVTEMEG